MTEISRTLSHVPDWKQTKNTQTDIKFSLVGFYKFTFFLNANQAGKRAKPVNICYNHFFQSNLPKYASKVNIKSMSLLICCPTTLICGY